MKDDVLAREDDEQLIEDDNLLNEERVFIRED
jgi:hypothetical protein